MNFFSTWLCKKPDLHREEINSDYVLHLLPAVLLLHCSILFLGPALDFFFKFHVLLIQELDFEACMGIQGLWFLI